MKKLATLSPGKLEEIAVITFFILFFVLTIVAESSAQVNGNPGNSKEFNSTLYYKQR
jgi:hypothetical protein